MADRNTRLKPSQIKDFSLTKQEFDATGETEAFVLTVQADGTVDYEQIAAVEEDDVSIVAKAGIFNFEDNISVILENSNKVTVSALVNPSFSQTFDNDDLSNSKIVISHKLDTEYPVVMVYNDLDEVIYPTDIDYLNSNQIQLDFTGLTPITSSYKIRVLGETKVSTHKENFTDADLSANKIIINHNLGVINPLVIVYDNNDQVFFPDEITGTDANNVQLDFTGATPLTGTYKVRVASSGRIDSYTEFLVDGDLTSDKITVTHNLETDYPIVNVYDNNDNYIIPTEIRHLTQNTVEVDFTGLTPLSGTYKVFIMGADVIPNDIIKDLDSDTRIEVEQSSDEDIIRITVSGEEQFIVQDGSILPSTDNDLDIGSVSKRLKDIYIAGKISDGTNETDVENLLFETIDMVIDGNGSAIVAGAAGDREVHFNCEILQVTLLADQTGDIVVDIYKDTFANYPPTAADSITGSSKPTISSSDKYQDSTLTGWTTTINAGDILRFNVDSGATMERCLVSLKVRKI